MSDFIPTDLTLAVLDIASAALPRYGVAITRPGAHSELSSVASPTYGVANVRRASLSKASSVALRWGSDRKMGRAVRDQASSACQCIVAFPSHINIFIPHQVWRSQAMV